MREDLGSAIVTDFRIADRDQIAISRDHWLGSHGSLTTEEVVLRFADVTERGTLLSFGGGTTIMLENHYDLDWLSDNMTIL